MDGNKERLRDIIELKYNDLVDDMELASALISNGRASDGISFIQDSWKIYYGAMELRGMITAYKIVIDDEDPEINLGEYEQTVSRCLEVLSKNLKDITQRYAEAEQHLRAKARKGVVK